MGTWNSRGLRGSTLEDMVNRTNEWYLEKNLALMQKSRPRSRRYVWIKNTDRSRWLILISAVRSIISVQCRGFRCVLMRRNVWQRHFRFRS